MPPAFFPPPYAPAFSLAGIPNTKHFHGITSIEDALALWEQLQAKMDVEAFKPDRDEEYEDTEGNVLNRATYEDLARQGLL